MTIENGGKGEYDPEILQEIEPGVRKLVETLNLNGIVTYSSCEGHIGGRKEPYPWVTFREQDVDERSREKLVLILLEWNIQNPSRKWELPIVEEPITRDENIDLFFLSPSDKNRALESSILKKLQEEALELAGFLNICF